VIDPLHHYDHKWYNFIMKQENIFQAAALATSKASAAQILGLLFEPATA